jgi:hypothetical protein
MLVMDKYLLSFVRANELFSLDHQRTQEELRQILCCTSSGSGHVTREKAVPEEIDLWSLR